MPDEEINRQENQRRIWQGKPSIYEHEFGVPMLDSPGYPEYWRRCIKPRLEKRWENLARYGHSEGPGDE
jgi:hypothetical protein